MDRKKNYDTKYTEDKNYDFQLHHKPPVHNKSDNR